MPPCVPPHVTPVPVLSSPMSPLALYPHVTLSLPKGLAGRTGRPGATLTDPSLGPSLRSAHKMPSGRRSSKSASGFGRPCLDIYEHPCYTACMKLAGHKPKPIRPPSGSLENPSDLFSFPSGLCTTTVRLCPKAVPTSSRVQVRKERNSTNCDRFREKALPRPRTPPAAGPWPRS